MDTGNPASTTPRPIRRRQRAALTCTECRRRKVKCDRKDPCQQCIAAQVECAYITFAKARAVPKRDARRRGTAKTASEPASEPGTRTATSPCSPPSRSPSPGTPAAEPSLDEGATPIWPQLLATGQDDARGNEASDLHRDVVDARQEGNAPRVLLNKTRMPTRGHVLGTASPFRLIVTCFLAATSGVHQAAAAGTAAAEFQRRNNGTKALVDEMGVLLAECKDVARRIKQCCRPSRTLSGVLLFDLEMPSREVADGLVDLYLGGFESTHRILHIPLFRTEYKAFWAQKEQQQQQQGQLPQQEHLHHRRTLKILLVLALGSSLAVTADLGAREHPPPEQIDLRRRAEQWIYAAQAWLAGPLEKDRLDITGIQIHCLTLLARQIFSVGGDLVWMSSGALVHTAMQTGLHRDPAHLSRSVTATVSTKKQGENSATAGGMSVLTAEVRRRLWATVLELAVQTARDAAMPVRISMDDFDTQAPANLDDEDLLPNPAPIGTRGGSHASRSALVLDSPTRPRGKPRTQFTDTSIQLILYESIPLRLRVLQRLNGLGPELSYGDVLGLSREISDAHSLAQSKLCRHITMCTQARRSQAPAHIQTTEPGQGHQKRHQPRQRPATTFHARILDLLIRWFLVHLHSPFVTKARANPEFHFSLQTTLDVAVDIVSPCCAASANDVRGLGGTAAGDRFGGHDGEEDDGSDAAFSRLLATAGGMFREVVRGALSIVCLELLAAMEDVMRGVVECQAGGDSERAKDGVGGAGNGRGVVVRTATSYTTRRHIAMLKSAAARIQEISLDRIRLGGETNIKGYMFIRLVMAQVAAFEDEVGAAYAPAYETIEYRLALEGRDTLLFCKSIVDGWATRLCPEPEDSEDVNPCSPIGHLAVAGLSEQNDAWDVMIGGDFEIDALGDYVFDADFNVGEFLS